jgi:hypothetical protein
MAYVNSQGQVRVFVRDGNLIGLGVPYVYVPPTILNLNSSTVIIAYSMRKLNTSYSGNVVRVRRSYDNAETDIPFASNGIIDSTTLKNFVDAGKALGDQDLTNWNSISYNNQQLISNGLIFNLDATNASSFSSLSVDSNNLLTNSSTINSGTVSNISYETSNGGTLGFNGSNSVINYSNQLVQTSQFTITSWVYINELPTTVRNIFSLSNDLYLNIGTSSISSTYSSSYGWITSYNTYKLNFGASFSINISDKYLNRWTEVTLVKGLTNSSIYIDGSKYSDSNTSLNFTSNYLNIGSSTQSFNGRLSTVKIWNRELTNSEVYQNYISITNNIYNQDHDALSFINASGLSQSVHINSITRLVKDLKLNGLWPKLKVVYPFVGGTEYSHKFNLKDPRDTNSAYRINFYGGWTHSLTGILPNGTNAWANTFYAPGNDSSYNGLNSNFLHMSVYSRTNNDNTGIEIGTQNNSSSPWYLQLKNGGYTYYAPGKIPTTSYNPSGQLRYLNSTSTGFYYMHRYFSYSDNYTTSNFFKDGTYLHWGGTFEILSSGAPTQSVYIGALNNGVTASNFSNREISFATVGDSLTDGEVSKLNVIIQTYQSSLGRQIGATYSSLNHKDLDIDMFINIAKLNQSQSNAIERLVSALKIEGIWHRTMAVYPMIGGNSTSHRFNLKSPHFNIIFGGGWTHSSTGAFPNGTNAYGSTGIIPRIMLSKTNSHLGFYTSTDLLSSNYDITSLMSSYQSNSSTDDFYALSARNNTSSNGNRCIVGGLNTSPMTTINVFSAVGFSFTMRGVTNQQDPTNGAYFMKNDSIDFFQQSTEGYVKFSTDSIRSITLSNNMRTTNFDMPCNREHQFTVIGDRDMTTLQAQKFGRIVERYQQDLNRSSNHNNFHKYTTGSGYVRYWYDQSGNSKHLRMDTVGSQPLIYENGDLVRENSKVSIQFDGWDDGMITPSDINFSNTRSVYFVTSGTSSGYRWNNSLGLIQQTTPSLSPSPITWTSNSRLSNWRMSGKDNPNNSGGFAQMSLWANGSDIIELYWGNGLKNASTLRRESGINVLNMYLRSTGDIFQNMEFSSNFRTDETRTGYGTGISNAASLAVGFQNYYNAGNTAYSNIKVQEIIYYGPTFSLSNKLNLDKNIYDFYKGFTYQTVDDSDADLYSLMLRLNSTQANAINNLVKGLKQYNLWNKMKAIYPMVGGNIYAHSINLKSPSYVDLSYSTSSEWRINYGYPSNSNLTTNVVFDNTGTLYKSTSLSINIYNTLKDNFRNNDFHTSYYVVSGPYTGPWWLGSAMAWRAPGSSPNVTNGLYVSPTGVTYQMDTAYTSATTSPTASYFIGNSTNMNQLYKNGILLATSSIAGTTMSNSSIAISNETSIKNSFMTFGYGLSSTDAQNLNTLVQAYQTALGR